VRTPRPLSRRELLELIAVIALSPACKSERKPAPTAGSASSTPQTPSPLNAPTALDAAAYRTLEAAAARILPAADGLPGASEAKVIDFIDRQLAIAPLTKVAPAMIALARALDDAARKRKVSELAQLPAPQQDALLEAVSQGTLGSTLPERELFRLLHGLVLEGYLCDPHHGGNRDQIAWKAIGFAEPTLRTRSAPHGSPHGSGHGSP
jgi:gluconate 2-dehydrogenase gamma chain